MCFAEIRPLRRPPSAIDAERSRRVPNMAAKKKAAKKATKKATKKAAKKKK